MSEKGRDVLLFLEDIFAYIQGNIPSYKRNIENILKNEVVVINDKRSKKP